MQERMEARQERLAKEDAALEKTQDDVLWVDRSMRVSSNHHVGGLSFLSVSVPIY